MDLLSFIAFLIFLLSTVQNEELISAHPYPEHWFFNVQILIKQILFTVFEVLVTYYSDLFQLQYLRAPVAILSID